MTTNTARNYTEDSSHRPHEDDAKKAIQAARAAAEKAVAPVKIQATAEEVASKKRLIETTDNRLIAEKILAEILGGQEIVERAKREGVDVERLFADINRALRTGENIGSMALARAVAIANPIRKARGMRPLNLRQVNQELTHRLRQELDVTDADELNR